MEIEAWLRLSPIHVADLNTSQRLFMCHICQFDQLQLAYSKSCVSSKTYFQGKMSDSSLLSQCLYVKHWQLK